MEEEEEDEEEKTLSNDAGFWPSIISHFPLSFNLYQ